MQDTELYLYGAIFLAALLLVEGMFFLFRDMHVAQERMSNRRARLQASGLTQSQTLRKLKRQRLTSDDTGKPIKSKWIGPLRWLDQLIDESGTMVSTMRFLILMAVICIVLLAVLVVAGGVSALKALPFALFFGIILPILYLQRKKAVKRRKLAEQLPDAIDMIVRSVRAGHPIRTSFNLVAREMEDPIGTEFGILVDEMTYGLDLEDALDNMLKRNDIPDLHYFAVTVNIQHGTGGNLAEVLSNLSAVIRDRFRMYKKVRALSAEGRLAAMVIAMVPFFTAFIMTVNKPSYYIEAAKNPIFPFIVGIALLLYFGAMYTVYKIVKIRV